MVFTVSKIVRGLNKIPQIIVNHYRAFLWESQNIRPDGLKHHWSRIPNNIEEKIFEIATQESAEYVIANMGDISGTIDPLFIIEYCTKRARRGGLFLEFGVFEGLTINHIASFTDSPVHGFDSFQGLPEDWGSCPKGAFSTQGKLPVVKNNVELHVGWFDNTLPEFLKNHSGDVSLLHIDSDLYSSAKTILSLLADRIVAGTIILFDEYFNYPGWKQHEYLAFQEFVKEHNVQYKYIGYCSRGYSVAVIIEEKPSNVC